MKADVALNRESRVRRLHRSSLRSERADHCPTECPPSCEGGRDNTSEAIRYPHQSPLMQDSSLKTGKNTLSANVPKGPEYARLGTHASSVLRLEGRSSEESPLQSCKPLRWSIVFLLAAPNIEN